jgi:hypothetical protein
MALKYFLPNSLTLTSVFAMSPPLHVRVASYNVLSSHLADPEHFSTLNPEHLAAKNRFPVDYKKLMKKYLKVLSYVYRRYCMTGPDLSMHILPTTDIILLQVCMVRNSMGTW